MTTKFEDIPVSKIKIPNNLMREVLVETEHFQTLRDGIEQHGLLHPITVRPVGDGYELVAGANRLEAHRALGRETIPAKVCPLTDLEGYALRIMENAARLEATPVQFARQIYAMFMLDPTLSQAKVAKMIGRSSLWVFNTMSLSRLLPQIQRLVDQGKIKLCNAYELSKINKRDQEFFVEKAMTLSIKEFKEELLPVMRRQQVNYTNFSEARRAEKQEGLQPFMRPMSHLLRDVEVKTAGAALITQCNVKTPLDAWVLALRWVMNMDPVTQAERVKNRTNEDDEPFDIDSFENEDRV